MTDRIQLSRRKALRLLSSAPLLPLGASLGLPALLSACHGGDGNSASSAAPIYLSSSFVASAAPSLANAAAMATTSVSSMLNVSFSDQSAMTYKLAYQPFFVTGDMVDDGKGGKILAGGYVDINNAPIIDRSVPGKERQFFSDSPDGTSLLSLPNASVAGVKGKAVFAVVQFEYTTRNQALADTYGQLPSPIAILTLDQDQSSGKLSLVKYHNVNTAPAHGLWITCGASLSPWNTHLSSEEYEPDASFAASSDQFKAFSRNLFGNETTANPYHYGHLPEVSVNPDGTGSIVKHYCLGRISHELVQVMPDKRTVLMGDDYTNGGLFAFVADKEADLSAGTLYVAKLGAGFSVDPAAPGAALSWIKIGHATSAEVEAMANTLKPADILTVALTDPLDSSYTRATLDGKVSWFKIKPGMEKAAAYLETHRYANFKGASMGFTKLEGTTVNIKDKVAYSALQNIQGSMVRGNAAWNEASNITVEKAIVAGGVLAHTLSGGLKDTGGEAIASEWMPSQTRMLFVGEDYATPDDLGNKANPERVANPDNLKFSEKMRTLFIGEDSSTHVNNMLWAYNVDTKIMTRLASMPVGAESTGLHVVDDLNGWTYIMSNFQHAGDWIPALHGKVQATLEPLVRANYKDRFGAAVGYFTAEATSIKMSKS
ncbi:MAG: alkaline phosphatase PhoX [Pseudomonadota bacterium]